MKYSSSSSPVKFEDSRQKKRMIGDKNYINNFIKTNNLRKLAYNDNDLEYYFDGTQYYIDDKNEVYRIFLGGIESGPHKKRKSLI